MAASRKKRAKPRAKVKAKTRTGPPSGLKTLDAEWRSFIKRAADDTPLTEKWPDPKGASSRPRKQAAKKKSAKKKARTKAVRKKATKK